MFRLRNFFKVPYIYYLCIFNSNFSTQVCALFSKIDYLELYYSRFMKILSHRVIKFFKLLCIFIYFYFTNHLASAVRFLIKNHRFHITINLKINFEIEVQFPIFKSLFKDHRKKFGAKYGDTLLVFKEYQGLFSLKTYVQHIFLNYSQMLP